VRASSIDQVRTMPTMAPSRPRSSLPEVADLSGGGADADDPPAVALFAESDRCRPGAAERAAHVDVENEVELLVGHFP
jgi:hypothetical protein